MKENINISAINSSAKMINRNGLKDFLDIMSHITYIQSVKIEFSKNVYSDKYKKGSLAAIKYLSDLSFYYLQREKKLKEDMIKQIHSELSYINTLADTDYKNGAIDILNLLLNELINEEIDTDAECK